MSQEHPLENRSSISVLNENSEAALATLQKSGIAVMETVPNGKAMLKIYLAGQDFLKARRALNDGKIPMRDIFVND
jgi:hypothetical protein